VENNNVKLPKTMSYYTLSHARAEIAPY
jgi:hypothetical protein